jgi:putative glutamine amidotransferase
LFRPLIGITTAVNKDYGIDFLRAYNANVLAIEHAGGIPVLIPCTLQPQTLRELYQTLDGVLLPGGGDVDPVHYNAQTHPKTGTPDPARDQTEIQITQWAIEDQRPIFGICRGHQVFNVALGGTLIQDIPSEVESHLTHDIADGEPRNQRLHGIKINPDSQLAHILGTTEIEVNSIHHQSVEQVAPDLTVTAYAPDGVVEASELPNHPFALTVQWHPEDMVNDSEAMRRLFSAFVEACAKRHA